MWIENKEDEKEIKSPTQTNAPTVGSGGGAVAGVSTTPTTGTVSTMSPVPAQQPTQKWATAQDYLTANQPQASDLGKKVETSLTGQLGTQKGTIESAAQKTQQDIAAGTTAFNPEIARMAVETPTEITSSPERLQDFLGQWNAMYKGPASFETSESYTPAVEAATKAKEIGENIKTPGGRTQLLQNQFGVYGAGNQALDTSLLSTAENYGQIQQLAPQFTGLQDYLARQSQDISGKAGEAQATTQAAQQQTRGALQGQLEKFQQDLENRTQSTQQIAQQLVDKYKADLDSGNTSNIYNDLQKAGFDIKQAREITNYMSTLKETYGVTPQMSGFYTFNPATDITKEKVASPEDYKKAQAWAQLTGDQGYTTVLNPAQLDQAGTAVAAQAGLKPNEMKAYLTKQVKTHDNELLAHNTIQEMGQKLGVSIDQIMNDAATAKRVVDSIAAARDRIITFGNTEGDQKASTRYNAFQKAFQKIADEFHSDTYSWDPKTNNWRNTPGWTAFWDAVKAHGLPIGTPRN
jgi:uncharacterized protein (UPF0335 family)